MAHPDRLVVGADYFLVHYYDEELLVPSITTLKYHGQAEAEDGVLLWTFRTLAPDGDSSQSDVLTGFNESQLHEVLDLDGLIAELNELLSVRPQLKPPVPIDAQNLLARCPLAARIEEFLVSPALRRLHISIRYKDQGLFLTKIPDRIELQLFTHPLRAPGCDARLTSLIRGRGLCATTDYLADKGRTRILSYPLSAEPRLVTELAIAILTAGYAMSDDDELLFSNDP